MIQLLRLTVTLLTLFTLAVVGVVCLMRIQPLRTLDIDKYDGNSRLGDFIAVLGTPTGADITLNSQYTYGWYIPDTMDVWFGNVEVDTDITDFGPYSVVVTANTPDVQTGGGRWRGFVDMEDK